METARDVLFQLLRNLGIYYIVGNPGSTEESFLQNFPKDFKYIEALQEASVVGIADGLCQRLKKPVIVNVHTAVGIGNGMGNILTAFQAKTPLILTSGQQTQEMLLIEPLLTNKKPQVLTEPWTKWSYEVSRAEDIPGAFLRAYIYSTTEPKGPSYLSIPLNLWDVKISSKVPIRQVFNSQ